MAWLLSPCHHHAPTKARWKTVNVIFSKDTRVGAGYLPWIISVLSALVLSLSLLALLDIYRLGEIVYLVCVTYECMCRSNVRCRIPACFIYAGDCQYIWAELTVQFIFLLVLFICDSVLTFCTTTQQMIWWDTYSSTCALVHCGQMLI